MNFAKIFKNTFKEPFFTEHLRAIAGKYKWQKQPLADVLQKRWS